MLPVLWLESADADLLMRPFEVSTAVQSELVEALRQAQGERFKLHGAGSIVLRSTKRLTN